MANIRVTCPTCASELEVDAAHEGQQVECGNCLQIFVAERPKPKSSAPRAPAARRRTDDDDDDRPRRRRRREDDDDDDYDYAPPPPRRSGGGAPGDGVAIASLVIGILTFVFGCCWPISFPGGVAAIITGALGLKSRNNQGLAITGIILGVLGLGVGAFVLLLGFAGNGGNQRFR